jgi:hypothetical protein
MRLSTVVALSLLLALGLLVVSAAIDEQELIRPHSTWRAPILKIATPTPTPEGGWWETLPTPFVQATGLAVKQPTREARP